MLLVDRRDGDGRLRRAEQAELCGAERATDSAEACRDRDACGEQREARRARRCGNRGHCRFRLLELDHDQLRTCAPRCQQVTVSLSAGSVAASSFGASVSVVSSLGATRSCPPRPCLGASLTRPSIAGASIFSRGWRGFAFCALALGLRLGRGRRLADDRGRVLHDQGRFALQFVLGCLIAGHGCGPNGKEIHPLVTFRT